MDEFDKKKIELLRPLMFEVGAALMDCQGMEYGIALLLFHFARMGNPGLDPEALSRVLDNRDKTTAGQLIHLPKKHMKVSPGIETALAEGLDARNLIVHRVLIDNIESFPFPEKRARLTQDIRALRRKVRHADKLLQPFILRLSEVLDDVKKDELEKEIRELFT